MAARTSISSPARTAFRILLSQKRTLTPTRITPIRWSSPTTTPEPPLPTTPAHRTPVTAAPPGPGSTQAPSQVDTGQTLAIRLLSTTSLPVVSLQFFWLRAAADRASALGSQLTVGSPGSLVPAFTAAAVTTVSPALPIITPAVRSSDGCTSHGTTSLLEVTSRFATLPTTVPPGPTSDNWPRPAHSSAIPRSPSTRSRATCTSPA